MRKLTKAENANLSCVIDAEAQKATTVHTVKPSSDSDVRYEMTWIFDFSECTPEQVLELAERSIRIRCQSLWRAAADKTKEEVWDNRTFDVAAVLSERRTSNPTERVLSAVKKMTAAEKEALMAELMKGEAQ